MGVTILDKIIDKFRNPEWYEFLSNVIRLCKTTDDVGLVHLFEGVPEHFTVNLYDLEVYSDAPQGYLGYQYTPHLKGLYKIESTDVWFLDSDGQLVNQLHVSDSCVIVLESESTQSLVTLSYEEFASNSAQFREWRGDFGFELNSLYNIAKAAAIRGIKLSELNLGGVGQSKTYSVVAVSLGSNKIKCAAGLPSAPSLGVDQLIIGNKSYTILSVDHNVLSLDSNHNIDEGMRLSADLVRSFSNYTPGASIFSSSIEGDLDLVSRIKDAIPFNLLAENLSYLLSVSTKQVKIQGSANSKGSFMIQGSDSWSLQKDFDWGTIESDVSGYGNKEIIISCNANQTGAERIGTVVVAGQHSSPVTVSVIQLYKLFEYIYTNLTDRMVINALSVNATLLVKTNQDWYVKILSAIDVNADVSRVTPTSDRAVITASGADYVVSGAAGANSEFLVNLVLRPIYPVEDIAAGVVDRQPVEVKFNLFASNNELQDSRTVVVNPIFDAIFTINYNSTEYSSENTGQEILNIPPEGITLQCVSRSNATCDYKAKVSNPSYSLADIPSVENVRGSKTVSIVINPNFSDNEASADLGLYKHGAVNRFRNPITIHQKKFDQIAYGVELSAYNIAVGASSSSTGYARITGQLYVSKACRNELFLYIGYPASSNVYTYVEILVVSPSLNGQTFNLDTIEALEDMRMESSSYTWTKDDFALFISDTQISTSSQVIPTHINSIFVSNDVQFNR